jgi:hypothetical protein
MSLGLRTPGIQFVEQGFERLRGINDPDVPVGVLHMTLICDEDNTVPALGDRQIRRILFDRGIRHIQFIDG